MNGRCLYSPVWIRGGGGRYTQWGRYLGRYTEGDSMVWGRYTRYLPHTILTSSDGHQSGRYASYWNAFLFLNIFGLPHLFPTNTDVETDQHETNFI